LEEWRETYSLEEASSVVELGGLNLGLDLLSLSVAVLEVVGGSEGGHEGASFATVGDEDLERQ